MTRRTAPDDWHRRSQLEWAFLDLYERDESFMRKLEIVGAFADAIPAIPRLFWQLDDDLMAQTYVSAVQHLAQECGLAGLSDCHQVIHFWCAGRREPSRYLFAAGSFSGGGVLTHRVRVDVEWDVLIKPEGVLREQIDRQVTEQIEQGKAQARELGYVVGRKRSNVVRDLGWLFEHVRHGRSYRQIAETSLSIRIHEADREDAIASAFEVVKSAVRSIAEDMGYKLPGRNGRRPHSSLPAPLSTAQIHGHDIDGNGAQSSSKARRVLAPRRPQPARNDRRRT